MAPATPDAAHAGEDAHWPSTILVCVDLSEESRHPVEKAVSLAGLTGARLVFATNIGLQERETLEEYGRTSREELEAACRAAHERLIESVSPSADATSVFAHDAFPAEGILGLVEETAADLVVCASHGRSGWRRWVLGSVAEAIVRQSPAPVLVVTGPGPGRASE